MKPFDLISFLEINKVSSIHEKGNRVGFPSWETDYASLIVRIVMAIKTEKVLYPPGAKLGSLKRNSSLAALFIAVFTWTVHVVRTTDIVNNLPNYRIPKYGAGGRLATLMGPEHPPSFKAKSTIHKTEMS